MQPLFLDSKEVLYMNNIYTYADWSCMVLFQIDVRGSK